MNVTDHMYGVTGSTNGTGLFQTITGLKIREVYEQLANAEIKPKV